MSHVSVTSLLPFLEGLRKGDQLLACQLQALQNKRVKFLSLWEEQHIGAGFCVVVGPGTSGCWSLSAGRAAHRSASATERRLVWSLQWQCLKQLWCT